MSRSVLKRLLLCLVLLAAALGGIALALSAYIVSSTRDRVLEADAPPPEGLDCILVLGCGVRPDGSPSHMLEDRMKRAVQLYQAGWSDVLLLSGDNRKEDYNEVGVMKRCALEQGVPEEAIVLDHAGLSTYDSIYRAKAIFGAETFAVITQEFHISRALYIADALGLEAWGVTSDLRPYQHEVFNRCREILARDKDALWCLVKPDPVHLGDPIPLRKGSAQ